MESTTQCNCTAYERTSFPSGEFPVDSSVAKHVGCSCSSAFKRVSGETVFMPKIRKPPEKTIRSSECEKTPSALEAYVNFFYNFLYRKYPDLQQLPITLFRQNDSDQLPGIKSHRRVDFLLYAIRDQCLFRVRW